MYVTITKYCNKIIYFNNIKFINFNNLSNMFLVNEWYHMFGVYVCWYLIYLCISTTNTHTLFNDYLSVGHIFNYLNIVSVILHCEKRSHGDLKLFYFESNRLD